ncbi:MAG: alanine--glyoxylate aminotransferase family protein, partial [Candidatus Caldarchaeum sp.]
MSELSTMGELIPPDRLLMGPGPSNVHWRVYRALATPIIGHLDPSFLSIMDEISSMLRAIFKTQNRLTIPISGTGSSGMEACFVNILEPGDKAIVCVNGLFGERMVDVASRCGARVIRIDEPWGKSFKPERVIESLKKNKDAKLLAIVHAETSTGVLQPLSAIGEFMKQGDTLFLVDCVTSLGGCDVRVDEWGIDLCYSATQKCLSIPPGLSPLTVSDKALERIKGRKSKTQSWY